MKNEKKAFTPECKNMLDNLDRKTMKQEITEEEWKKELIRIFKHNLCNHITDNKSHRYRLEQEKAPDESGAFLVKWYRRPESNRHGQSPSVFETDVSTNSTTSARGVHYMDWP